MKIGILSNHDCNDKKAFSGTLYKIKESLSSSDNEVLWIPIRIGVLYKLYIKVCSLWQKITGQRILPSKTTLGARLYCLGIDMSILGDADVIIAPFQSVALRFLKTEKKIIYVTDATFNLLNGYYSEGVTHWNEVQGNKIEQSALDRSDYLVFSSRWAANSAKEDYCQSESKIKVLEFGPNIDLDLIPLNKRRYEGHLNVLFSGVDWIRKGGDLAVEACQYLHDNGVSVTLHIVGIKNLKEEIKNLPFVKWHGFLNKNDAIQYEKYIDILQQCHCLLLPTIAECSAIVYSESCALGMPIFTHNTGGVANYVINEKNGYCLPIGSKGVDFGKIIFHVITSGKYEAMSEQALDLYHERLNWNRWGKEVLLLCEDK